METLNYKVLEGTGYNGYILKDAPVKVMQFGEGNFLRAFVDYFYDIANEKAGYNGKVKLVQPIGNFPQMADWINEQEGLYTLYLRGSEKGQKVDAKRVISCVSDCVCPYIDNKWDEVLALARSEDLETVVSNTTEAGIAYTKGDSQFDQVPPNSFPAKLTRVLFERYKAFNGAADKGLVILSCELIDNNGKELQKCCNNYAKDWDLEPAFIDWMNTANTFCSTLVDRIVPGRIRDPKELAALDGPDVVLNSVVGIAGLGASLCAIESGHDLALANKESLVTGGHLVTQAVEKHGVQLLPVDSEHSAIFQCLQDKESAPSLTKILLTASGGPFFGMTTEQLRGKTRVDALKHPNWNMGAKITIDSATLMNKGLELIEAVWLFGLPPEKIQIVVQRQSIVHSAVQFSDNSIIAQLGVPDMRIPIQYALTYPKRVPGVVPELDFTTLKLLTFDVADEETFRCLAACKKAIRKGGLGPCAANGANEEAVKLFLEDKIGFLDIGRLVEAVVDSDSFGGDYTLADVYECDRMARAFVQAHL